MVMCIFLIHILLIGFNKLKMCENKQNIQQWRIKNYCFKYKLIETDAANYQVGIYSKKINTAYNTSWCKLRYEHLHNREHFVVYKYCFCSLNTWHLQLFYVNINLLYLDKS